MLSTVNGSTVDPDRSTRTDSPIDYLPLKIRETIQMFTLQLRQGRVAGPNSVNVPSKNSSRSIIPQASFAAQGTAQIMRAVISATYLRGKEAVLKTVREVGRDMAKVAPMIFVVQNITRRVLKLVKEEFDFIEQKGVEQSTKDLSLREDGGSDGFDQELNDNSFVDDVSRKSSTGSRKEMEFFNAVRTALHEDINEIIDDISLSSSQITEQCLEHIHSNEVILTYGYSVTVENFLTEAAKKRKFEVIVAENSPSCSGHVLAKNLATAVKEDPTHGISVTVISDSAAFAMMSRVNKVILGTHAVMADGSLIASAGSHMIAEIAKFHSVPIAVCTALYKITPVFPHDRDIFNDFLSPASLMSYETASSMPTVRFSTPLFDLVPPTLVSLFITNNGCYSPSYIYRLLRDYYDEIDEEL